MRYSFSNNIEILKSNTNILLSTKESDLTFLMMSKNRLNSSSYHLFYLLVQTNMINSLKEIHIELENSNFKVDLFKLLKTYCEENKVQSRIKLFSIETNLIGMINLKKLLKINTTIY